MVTNEQIDRLREQDAYWPDDIGLTDTEVFDHAELLRPMQITDRYLLALASGIAV